MAQSDVGSMLGYIRGLVGAGRFDDLPDQQLLQRFVALREESAYAALLQRHGPMVLGVCGRVLRRAQDVEDAFQATFLLLARGAQSIRNPDAVGGWLHGVARRVAMKLRAKLARQSAGDAAAPETPPTRSGAVPDPTEEATWKELRLVLDEELARLPLDLRAPLVLCYLEGRTQDEGAKQLGWTRRAFRRRLEKGRDQLSRRLARRGITLSAALFPLMLSQASAIVPESLRRKTLEAGMALAAGRAGSVSAACGLAESLYPSLAGSKSKKWLVLLLAMNLAATGAILAMIGGEDRQALRQPVNGAPAPAQAPIIETPVPVETAHEDDDLNGAVATLTGRVLDAAGKPVPGARVAALARRPYHPGEQGLRHDVLRQGEADAEGRFRLTIPAEFRSWFPEREVALWASAPGYAPGTLAVPLRPGEASFDLNLPPARPLRARLVDQDGAPVAGVKLEVVRLGNVLREIIQTNGEAQRQEKNADEFVRFDLWPSPATTDEQGFFELPNLGVVRNLWLQIQDDRFAVSTFPAEYSDGRPIDDRPYGVMVVAGQVLEGVVTAADTGKPVPHARLTAISPNEWTASPRRAMHAFAPAAACRSAHFEFDARADAAGRYRLRLPNGLHFHVEARPPSGSPYLPLGQMVVRPAGQNRLQCNFTLQRGVQLSGRVRSSAGGRPVEGAVAYYVQDPEKPHTPRDLPPGPDVQAVSGADGRLDLAVPAGRGRLLVYVPGGNFLPRSSRSSRDGDLSGFAHSVVDLDLPADRLATEVDVVLREGITVSGKVVGPDGKPLAAGILVSGRHVHPLTPGTAQPLPIAGGEFSLPGCEKGQTYPVLFLDASRQFGAAAELSTVPGAANPVVKLQPCGQASVRFVDAGGRPLTNVPVNPTVMLDPGTAASDAAGNKRRIAPSPHEAAWAVPMQYSHTLGPHTDAGGFYTLTALVPDARYRIAARLGGPGWATPCFSVRPGEAMRLPDVVAPNAAGKE